jgi:hypothetical protein
MRRGTGKAYASMRVRAEVALGKTAHCQWRFPDPEITRSSLERGFKTLCSVARCVGGIRNDATYGGL